MDEELRRVLSNMLTKAVVAQLYTKVKCPVCGTEIVVSGNTLFEEVQCPVCQTHINLVQKFDLEKSLKFAIETVLETEEISLPAMRTIIQWNESGVVSKIAEKLREQLLKFDQ